MNSRDIAQRTVANVDKLSLVRDVPIEVLTLLPQLMEALRRIDRDPVEVFQRLLTRANDIAKRVAEDE